MAPALCRACYPGFRVSRSANIRERRMSPPPCVLNLRAFGSAGPLSQLLPALPAERAGHPVHTLTSTLLAGGVVASQVETSEDRSVPVGADYFPVPARPGVGPWIRRVGLPGPG